MKISKIICFTIVVVIIIVSLSGCVYEIAGGVKNEPNHEWVSPEGVHYWCWSNGYMAPRYNNDGTLMIDDCGDFE